MLGCDGDAQAAEFAAGLHGLRRVGEALDEGAEFAGAGFVLFHVKEGDALVEMRCGDLVAVGILLEDGIVGLDGGGVVAVAEVDLGLVVEGVS